jgi:hypothetical protein
MSRTRPLHVRPLTDAERQVLQDSLRAPDAFVLRRAQIVLSSAAGEQSGQIAPRVGFRTQGVRNVIQACNARGLDVLRPGSPHPGAVVSAVDTPHAVAWRDLLHQSPRHFGQDTSRWTLELAADVAYAQGLTPTRVSGVTIRNTLARMGVRWRRAKEWLTSPAPEDARKKARRDRLIRLARPHPDWLLGFADEVWWRRLAPPALHAWQDEAPPLRLIEQTIAPEDPAPRRGPATASWPAPGTRPVSGRRTSGCASSMGVLAGPSRSPSCCGVRRAPRSAASRRCC